MRTGACANQQWAPCQQPPGRLTWMQRRLGRQLSGLQGVYLGGGGGETRGDQGVWGGGGRWALQRCKAGEIAVGSRAIWVAGAGRCMPRTSPLPLRALPALPAQCLPGLPPPPPRSSATSNCPLPTCGHSSAAGAPSARRTPLRPPTRSPAGAPPGTGPSPPGPPCAWPYSCHGAGAPSTSACGHESWGGAPPGSP